MQIAHAVRAAAPKAPDESVEAVVDLGIKDELRLAHFIGQLAHESGFKPLNENLNYSAKRLTQVWPSRFRSLAATNGFARNPMALANKVYNGRMGNKAGSNDGWNFRGRGFIQLTGRTNYTKCGAAIGIDLVKTPDRLLEPEVSAKAAAWFFEVNNIWPLCDKNDVRAVTRRINGGVHGLGDRRAKTQAALSVLRGGAVPLSTVRLGSRGSDARLLQSALNELGFGPISADGIFGRNSDKALRRMQAAFGLAVDGICGRNTWKLIASKGATS